MTIPSWLHGVGVEMPPLGGHRTAGPLPQKASQGLVVPFGLTQFLRMRFGQT